MLRASEGPGGGEVMGVERGWGTATNRREEPSGELSRRKK